MDLAEKIQVCSAFDELPEFKEIKSLSRGVKLKVIFKGRLNSRRAKVGARWKLEHPEFQIGVHTIEPEINIIKLITDEEIVQYQDFVEQCAKDYRRLAIELINGFANEYNLKIDPDFPMRNLGHTSKYGYKPVGVYQNWKYAFHGIHCAFTNLKTGQYIEVPLNYGLEFGQLNPYFFIAFINSTKEYKPLPIDFFCGYADGLRILTKMVELGKFEYVNSNFPTEKGIVVTERDKVKVKTYDFESKEDVEIESFKEKGFWHKLKKLFT